TVDPASAAVGAAPYPALAQTGVDDVGVGRVDGEALRAAPGQGQLDRPGLPCLVKSGDAVAGGGIEACHPHRVRTRVLALPPGLGGGLDEAAPPTTSAACRDDQAGRAVPRRWR